jgi:hypothetical protein
MIQRETRGKKEKRKIKEKLSLEDSEEHTLIHVRKRGKAYGFEREKVRELRESGGQC